MTAVTISPDYSWVSDSLSNLCGGILALCIICAVMCLAVGAVRWAATKMTRTLVDDPHGDSVLITCLVASLLIASLAGAVQWGINGFGSQTVGESTSSANGTWNATGGATQTTQDHIDAAKKSCNPFNLGKGYNPIKCVSDTTQAAGSALGNASSSAESSADKDANQAVDEFDQAKEAADNRDLAGTIKHGAKGLVNGLKSEAEDAWSKVSGWVSDRLGGGD